MAGGIRYIVCCDDCGVDADEAEYATEAIAQTVRDWVSTVGGWLWRKPNTEDQWLTCPECSAQPLSAVE